MNLVRVGESGLRNLVVGLATVLTLMGCAGDDTMMVSTGDTGPPPPDPEPCITVAPASLNFGEVRVGDATTLQLTVGNDCPGALEVTGAVLEGGSAGFGVLDAPALPFALAEGEDATVTVEFRPEAYEALVDDLTLSSNDPDSASFVVALTGFGVCESAAADTDTDSDGFPDACDVCAEGDDGIDTDGDAVPDACDICAAGDDALDADTDGVPDDCDLCEGFDDAFDGDADAIPDGCDVCPNGSNVVDTDGDTVVDGCDVCEGFDDLVDTDVDQVPDGCDTCDGFDDLVDVDVDGVPDGCDVCPGFDDLVDVDVDGVADGCDVCPGFDDLLDTDGEGVPDGCDICPGFDDFLDDDADAFPNGCDVCPGFDDLVDTDFDTVPDGCDACPGFDDALDMDNDGRPDDCDVCPGFDDAVDTDNDTVADGCDLCPGADDAVDTDSDAVPDGCDVCPGADDTADADSDTVPDGCDICAGADDTIDTDADSVPDGCDICPGSDDSLDTDNDGIPDDCDACPTGDDAIDADGDGVPDGCDVCPNFDDAVDQDGDGVPDDCDACPGFDDSLDNDVDGIPDDCDGCPGFDDASDADVDGIADGCDRCPGSDDLVDTDADGVPDDCDQCPQFDDAVDTDLDQIPDGCDTCLGQSTTLTVTPPTNQVDVLLVVNNDQTMLAYTAVIPLGVGAFVNQMNANGANWQVAVVNTSSPTLLGPVIAGGPNAAALLAAQLGFVVSPTALDAGIDQAWSATQTGGGAGPGSAFLRTGSALGLVFITDSPDNSVETAQSAYDYWLGLGNLDPTNVRVGAIQDGAPDPLDDLAALAGGPVFDITTVNWASASEEIADVMAATVPRVPLGAVPVPGTIEVEDNGVRLTNWFYDASTGELVFPEGVGTATALDVTFIEDCGGTLNACNDGIDNDNDGAIDFPEEPGCATPGDSNEADPPVMPTCDNGIDDDGDGSSDWPGDAECQAASDDDEDCFELASDAFGYTMCESNVPTCPDLSALPSSLALGSTGSTSMPLGFAFDFYGTTYSDVTVGGNGTLQFGADTLTSSNACLPSPIADHAILVFWDQLAPAAGDVWARTDGVAPNRSFAVQWRVPHGFAGTQPFDVRAVLSESTGDIELCYVDTIGGNASFDNGASATAGIQRDTISWLEYGCFDGNLLDGTAVRFEHP